jgi:hypothetical protein
MLETALAPWAVLLLLGALHGLNPGMGWLFAVALGLQEGSGRAVWRALGPLALGHALAVVAALGVAVLLGLVIPVASLRWVVAGALFGMGIFQLRRHRHPRWGGMHMGPRDLAIWGFLMATAHGAGLMALPFVPGAGAGATPVHTAASALPMLAPETRAAGHAHVHPAPAHPGRQTERAGHGPTGSAADSGWTSLLATLVHTFGYLLATGTTAAVVFYRLGLRLLQRAWLNVNLVWAAALIATAVLLPLL